MNIKLEAIEMTLDMTPEMTYNTNIMNRSLVRALVVLMELSKNDLNISKYEIVLIKKELL